MSCSIAVAPHATVSRRDVSAAAKRLRRAGSPASRRAPLDAGKARPRSGPHRHLGLERGARRDQSERGDGREDRRRLRPRAGGLGPPTARGERGGAGERPGEAAGHRAAPGRFRRRDRRHSPVAEAARLEGRHAAGPDAAEDVVKRHGSGDCPHPLKLLTLVDQGEHVPHLRECPKCAKFVDTAKKTWKTFADTGDVERTLSRYLDDILADTYGHRMSSAVRVERELHRTIVVRELLRRAGENLGSSPSRYLDLTDAAVVACEEMTAAGHPPEPELYIEALREYSTALRQHGSLDAAMQALGRAFALVEEA